MATHLVVTDPFADYAKGDRITDPDKIKTALELQPNRVVRINVDDTPPETAEHQGESR